MRGGGSGAQHSLLLAKEGAKVVVNDIGANVDGTGRDDSFAAQTVAEIKKMGGEAIVNGDDVSSWDGAKNLIDQAVKHFGKLDVLINNAGILRDRMLVNMSEDEWDAVIQVHLKGTFAPSRHAAAYWREKSKEIGGPVKARDHQHQLDVGHLRQRRADQLRRRQGRHRRLHHHRRARAEAHRRHRQRALALGADPHDRGPARADARADRRARPEMGVADRRLSGQRGSVRHHRARVPGGLRPHRRRSRAGGAAPR